MRWTPIRVNKYTRELHPEDHIDGLPKPGPLAEDNHYERWRVKQNPNGEWIGGNGIINLWLSQQTAYYAEPKEEQATEVPTSKKKRQPRRKPKPVQQPKVEEDKQAD